MTSNRNTKGYGLKTCMTFIFVNIMTSSCMQLFVNILRQVQNNFNFRQVTLISMLILFYNIVLLKDKSLEN